MQQNQEEMEGLYRECRITASQNQQPPLVLVSTTPWEVSVVKDDSKNKSSSITINQPHVKDSFTQPDPMSHVVEMPCSLSAGEKCDKSTQTNLRCVTYCENERWNHLCIGLSLPMEEILIRICLEHHGTGVHPTRFVKSDAVGQETSSMPVNCCYDLNVENSCACHKKSSQENCVAAHNRHSHCVTVPQMERAVCRGAAHQIDSALQPSTDDTMRCSHYCRIGECNDTSHLHSCSCQLATHDQHRAHDVVQGHSSSTYPLAAVHSNPASQKPPLINSSEAIMSSPTSAKLSAPAAAQPCARDRTPSALQNCLSRSPLISQKRNFQTGSGVQAEISCPGHVFTSLSTASGIHAQPPDFSNFPCLLPEDSGQVEHRDSPHNQRPQNIQLSSAASSLGGEVLVRTHGPSAAEVTNTRRVQKLKKETLKPKCKVVHVSTPVEYETCKSCPCLSKESKYSGSPTSPEKQQNNTDNIKMDESDGDKLFEEIGSEEIKPGNQVVHEQELHLQRENGQSVSLPSDQCPIVGDLMAAPVNLLLSPSKKIQTSPPQSKNMSALPSLDQDDSEPLHNQPDKQDNANVDKMFEELNSVELKHVNLVLRQQELLQHRQNGQCIPSPSDQRLLFRKLTAPKLPLEVQSLLRSRPSKMCTPPPQSANMSALHLLERDDFEASHNPSKNQQDLGCDQEIAQTPMEKKDSTKMKASPFKNRMQPLPVTFLKKKCLSVEEPKTLGTESNCKKNAAQAPISNPLEVDAEKEETSGKARSLECPAMDGGEVVVQRAKRKRDLAAKPGSKTLKRFEHAPDILDKPTASEMATKTVKLDVEQHLSSVLMRPQSSVTVVKRALKRSSKSKAKCHNINAELLEQCGKPDMTKHSSSLKNHSTEKVDKPSLRLCGNSAEEPGVSLEIEDSDGSVSGQLLKERKRREKRTWLSCRSTSSHLGIADFVGNASVAEAAKAHDTASFIILDHWYNVNSLKTKKKFVCPSYDKKSVLSALWELRNHKASEDVTNSILSLSWNDVHPAAFRTLVSMFVSSLSRQSAFHMERVNKTAQRDIESQSSSKGKGTSRPISTALTAVASRFILEGEWIEGLMGLLLEVQAVESAKLQTWCLPKLQCGRCCILLGPVAYLTQSKHFNTRVCLRNAVYVGVQATHDIPMGQQLLTTYSENLGEF